MKRLTMMVLMTVMLTSICTAQENTCPSANDSRHDIRIGLSENIFVWALEVPSSPQQPDEKYATNAKDYAVWNIDYHYRINKWLKVGAQFIFNYGKYDVMKNGQGLVSGCSRTDLWIMPSVKFTYYTSDWVRLYSGVAIGVNWSYGDIIYDTRVGVGGQITAFGVSVGKYRWFADFELGGTTGSGRAITALPTRILSISVGYRF